MLTILHGEQTVKSRQELAQLKSQFARGEIVQFSASVDLTTLTQALESQSLFGGNRLVIVENLLSERRKKKHDDVLTYLQQQRFTTPLILWEDKSLSASQLAGFKNATVKQFKPEAALFAFLDSLKPGYQLTFFPLLQKTRQTEPIELIFFMIVRQVRLLLALKSKAKIPEVMRLAPWQKNKLENQAHAFSYTQLRSLHRGLYTAEYSQKTGQSLFTLNQALDIVLTEL